MVVPFKLKPTQFEQRYRRGLDKLSPLAIAALRVLLARPIEPGVTAAEVQVFVPEDDPHEPSVWIYYTGPDNKVDAGDDTLHAGRSLELKLGFESLEAFDERFYSDDGYGGLDIVARVLTAWFAECWWKAGGWACALPVLLAVHDGHGGQPPCKLTELAR